MDSRADPMGERDDVARPLDVRPLVVVRRRLEVVNRREVEDIGPSRKWGSASIRDPAR